MHYHDVSTVRSFQSWTSNFEKYNSAITYFHDNMDDHQKKNQIYNTKDK